MYNNKNIVKTTMVKSQFKKKRPLVPDTIQIFFLIWISHSFKNGASDNTISYFDQCFRFSGLWLILARDLGRSGQNMSWGTEIQHVIFFLIWTVRIEYHHYKLFFSVFFPYRLDQPSQCSDERLCSLGGIFDQVAQCHHRLFDHGD